MARVSLPREAIALADGLVYFWPQGRAMFPGYIYFTQTPSLCYDSFRDDFGPLNLAKTYRFVTLLFAFLKRVESTGDPLVFLAPGDLRQRSNAAAVICISIVILCGMQPEEVCAPLEQLLPPLLPFRDASAGKCVYDLHVKDVVAGVYQAMLNGFVNFKTFNLKDYELHKRMDLGDFNWIVDGKFISMSSPYDETYGWPSWTRFCVEDYISYFKAHNVTAVVRLNEPMYNRPKFTSQGFKHYEMCFRDGTNPPDHILQRFLKACEEAKGAIAVHCTAGLGRTGTMVACYIMKHYHLTAAETIAWLRVARPGSVIGRQQRFVEDHQEDMWKAGADIGVRRKSEQDRPQWARDMIVAPRGSAVAAAFELRSQFPLAPVSEGSARKQDEGNQGESELINSSHTCCDTSTNTNVSTTSNASTNTNVNVINTSLKREDSAEESDTGLSMEEAAARVSTSANVTPPRRDERLTLKQADCEVQHVSVVQDAALHIRSSNQQPHQQQEQDDAMRATAIVGLPSMTVKMDDAPTALNQGRLGCAVSDKGQPEGFHADNPSVTAQTNRLARNTTSEKQGIEHKAAEVEDEHNHLAQGDDLIMRKAKTQWQRKHSNQCRACKEQGSTAMQCSCRT
eukprot:m.25670 g.25670  ORF g.25670 m.25670 type:complete len:624 (+) comp9902_c0_seq1:127-1998(+)